MTAAGGLVFEPAAPVGMHATDETRFPAANYFIAGSRLRPPLDGGYTISALRRAMHFRDYGAVEPVLLTFEFWPEAPNLIQWRDEGWIDFPIRERNLFRELRTRPEALLAAARTDDVPADTLRAADDAALELRIERDAAGNPWRTLAVGEDGVPRHTDYLDHEGRPVLRVPYVQRPDWHRAAIAIDVLTAEGSVLGWLDGFSGLYRAWLTHVLDTSAPGLNTVVCESKQVGELICTGQPRDRFTLVHTVHSTHVAAPFEWDSPIDVAWTGWFEVAHHFDGVFWLSQRQLDHARKRFDNLGRAWVVPHPAEPLPERPDPALRDPYRAIMVARLAPVKQADHLVRAFATVLRRLPEAKLDIYGDGPEQPKVQAVVDELGIGHAVTLHGYSANAADAAKTAALLAVTSKYEGQTLVMLEAVSRACPVVSYDINYGCAEMIDQDVSGLLVPKNDESALAEAMLRILGNPDTIARYSDGAWDWAHRHDAHWTMSIAADAFRSLRGVNRK